MKAASGVSGVFGKAGYGVLCVLALVLAPAAGMASECMELYKQRNDLFHKKGYCFAEPLGQAYYGVDGCTTKSPEMSALETALIRRIKAREVQLECAAEAKGWTAAALREAVGEPEPAAVAPKRQSLASLAEPKVDGATWRKVQAALGLAESGVADAATRASIEAWQAANRLNQTGYLTSRQMNALLQSQGAVAVSTTPEPARNAPIVLSERRVINLRHTVLEADVLLLAAMKSMPPSAERNQMLQSLMSSGSLSEFIDYGPQDWRDAAGLDRFAAKLEALAFPRMGPISISMQTGLYRQLQIRSNQQQDMTAPIEQVLGGQAGLQKYGVYQTRLGTKVPVHMDVPELPDLNSLRLTAQQASAMLAHHNAYKLAAYVHLDVTDFRYDKGKAALVIKVRYRGADIRHMDSGQVLATYPAQAAPKAIPKGLSQLQVLARIMQDGAPPNGQSAKPQFIDGYLHLGTANNGSQLLTQYVVSAMARHAPELLKDDTFALDYLPVIMSYAERMQLFRGTAMHQQGYGAHSPGSSRLNGFDRRDVINRLQREFGAALKARAKAEPMKLLHVLGVGLGEYDFASQSFPMTYQTQGGAGNAPMRQITTIRVGTGATNVMFDDHYVVPRAFPVPEQDARGIATRRQSGQLNGATIAFELNVDPLQQDAAMAAYKAGQGDVPFPNQSLDARIVSMTLYADRNMTEKLYQFPLEQRPAPAIGLLPPAKADQITPANYAQAMRAAIAGPNGDDVLEMVTIRSKPYQAASHANRVGVKADFARFYGLTGEGRDIWADASILLTEYLADAQAFRIQGQISRGFDMQSLDQRYNGNVQFTEPDMFDLGLLPVTDAMLTEQNSVFYGYTRNDLPAMQGQMLGGGHRLYAKVRFVPNVTRIDGRAEGRNTVYLYVSPDIREYYILTGQRTMIGGLQTVAYERFDGLTVDDAPLAEAPVEEAPVEEVVDQGVVEEETPEEGAVAPDPVAETAARDVLGLYPGMGRAEAEALIGAHMEGAERFASSGAPGQPFANGEMWVRPDLSERITLYYGNDADAETVFGLLRVTVMPDFAIPSDALEAATTEKYGPPDSADRTDGLSLVWRDAGASPVGACALAERVDDGPVWSGGGAENVPLSQVLGYGEATAGMLPLVPDLPDFAEGEGRYAGCGATLTLTQTAAGIVFMLVDPGAYEAAITPPEPVVEEPAVPMIKL